jgi:hypothetical protein
MKRIAIFAFLILVSWSTYAQYSTVLYNAERNNFNENQALPAENNFIINGAVGADINQVDVTIYRSGDAKRKKPLYQGVWKRPYGNNKDMFSIPMNYKLRSGGEYDFNVDYYRTLSETEQEYLKVRLFQTLDAYVVSSLEVNRRTIELLKPYRIIMNDINTIVEDGLSIYKTRTERVFDGFSDVVKGKIKQIEDADLKSGKYMFGQKKRESKALYAQSLLDDLLKLIHNEVEQVLNAELLTVKESKMVDDYPVAKNKGSLSLNLGYGGTHFSGALNNLDYGSSPFLGVSLPFGRKAFSPFWSNTSLSAGVFLYNFENAAGQEISGPIVKRPTYVGLGYKLFKFVRLNAGATFTEKISTTDTGLNLKDVQVRPFVGISAEINLAVSFGDK